VNKRRLNHPHPQKSNQPQHHLLATSRFFQQHDLASDTSLFSNSSIAANRFFCFQQKQDWLATSRFSATATSSASDKSLLQQQHDWLVQVAFQQDQHQLLATNRFCNNSSISC